MIFVVRGPTRVFPGVDGIGSLEPLGHTVPTHASSSSFRFGDVIDVLHKLSELADSDFVDSHRERLCESYTVLPFISKIRGVRFWPQLLDFVQLAMRRSHIELTWRDECQLHTD